jgi:endonuclease YncB( thermonuclease family)
MASRSTSTDDGDQKRESNSNTNVCVAEKTEASASASASTLHNSDHDDNPNTKRGHNNNMQSMHTLRQTIGHSMGQLSDVVNDNLITIRYATLSSILLLGAYSISQTPLFFRYRTLQELPHSIYKRRRVLTCRLFQVDVTAAATEEAAPIILHVRHLSPMGRLLSKQQLDFGLQHSPSVYTDTDTNTTALGKNKKQLNNRDLIRIQLDGVSQHEQSALLQQLARDRALVRCQFIASSTAGDDAAAIARLSYWQKRSVWPLDLGSQLVENGLARLQEDVLQGQKHGSDQLKDKQRDIKYLESLSKLEFQAISKRNGMWSIPQIRASAKDLVEHVEWEISATWYRKLWRRMTGRQ